MPGFDATPTTAVLSTVVTASVAAPASSAAPSSTAGLFTGFGVSSAAASSVTTTAASSSTVFSLLTKGPMHASSSQAQASTTLPAFGQLQLSALQYLLHQNYRLRSQGKLWRRSSRSGMVNSKNVLENSESRPMQ